MDNTMKLLIGIGLGFAGYIFWQKYQSYQAQIVDNALVNAVNTAVADQLLPPADASVTVPGGADQMMAGLN